MNNKIVQEALACRFKDENNREVICSTCHRSLNKKNPTIPRYSLLDTVPCVGCKKKVNSSMGVKFNISNYNIESNQVKHFLSNVDNLDTQNNIICKQCNGSLLSHNLVTCV